MAAIASLSFVAVAVPSELLEASVAFYTDVLGFQVVPVPGDAGSGTTKTGDGIWLQHFRAGICLRLSTGAETGSVTFVSESLETLADALTQRAVQFKQQTEGAQVTGVVTKDPAGNTLMFSSHSSPFSSQKPAAAPASDKASAAAPAQAPRGSAPMKRIGVLTSGGDSAGMNAALRGIVRAGVSRNCEVYAIREGYQGMIEGGSKNIVLLRSKDVSGIISEGGTVIGTARSKEMRTREGRLKAVYNLVEVGIDAIVVIGGDGSLTGANLLRKEWPDLLSELLSTGKITKEVAARHPVFAVVGMVGSIDNDMCGTYMTIGADTALHRAVEAIDSLSSTAASHQRAFVVEIMGRNCGWLALQAALACGADWMLIPEAPSRRDDWEVEMCGHLHKRKELGKRKLIIVVSEGAVDKNGKPIKSDYVRTVIETQLKVETRTTVLGHVQRGGKPSAFDRILPTMQGVDAVDAILEMNESTPAPMVGVNENKVTRFPLVDCVEQTLSVGKAMAALNFDEAMRLRGPDFVEAVQTFNEITVAEPKPTIDKTSNLRIAVIHVGAPAGGVNAATRIIVHLGVSRGYTILGFEGLAAGEVEELDWMSVEGWSMKGGSELGTNRSTPSDDYGMMAFNLQKFNVNALVVIGGFEGFVAVKELTDNRNKYPQFCIPIVHLPATISNNVPCSDFTLGCDTALNIVIEAIDELKQSASSSKRRVFVVETMGGQTGFLATLSSIGGGATRCYIPEDGITFQDLANDLELLKRKFQAERGTGRVILRCENSSNTYTTEFIASLLNEEGTKCGLWDARTANLGGGMPSPLDRVRGVRMATRCLAFLETQLQAAAEKKRTTTTDVHYANLPVYIATPESAAVIGYVGDEIKLTPIGVATAQADFKLRKPKQLWWRSTTKLVPILAGFD